ncbi:MAG: RidA family protein [Pseudomonadota bacterium]
MLSHLTPDSIRPPFAKYSHAVEVPEGMRLIACSGQLGISLNDDIPPDTEAQARLCFDNIRAILGEAGMDLTNIVRINAYVSGREHLKHYMKVRDELFGDPAPASTLMIVSGFAREDFTVEIEALAAGLPR